MQDNLIYKYIIILAIAFIIIGCRSKSSIMAEPIKIVLTIYGGDHSYCLLIGSDSSKLGREYYSIGEYRSNLDRSFDVHKYLLSQGAVDYIWKYIQENCTPSTGKFPNSENFYNIGKASDTPLYKNGCVVESKELAIKYYDGLIKCIENSPYKNECKYLIGDIRGKFIQGKAFPLTREQEELLNPSSYHSK